jgi:hypothetical protein
MPAELFDIAGAEHTVGRIHALLVGHTGRRDEREILGLLRAAGAAELDHVITRVDLRWLVSGVDDRVLGPDNRAALLAMLCEERLGDLSVRARAALIDALQRGRTGSDDERAIHKILLGTCGATLTELKNAIDDGDHHDLHHLVHHDLDDGELRLEILAHIQREAAPHDHLKVLSDIDDTLYRNWKDPRYPDGRDKATGKLWLYPGVRAFYRELCLAFPPGGLGDLTFITARPGDRVGIGQGITRKNLAEAGLPFAKVLTGELGSVITNQRIAEKKYERFVEYSTIFPEYRFVFCGDSGQGDAIAGRMMMEHPGTRMLAVFIHDVVSTSDAERAASRERGVFFNDTYVGAAIDAHALGLLDLDAALRVAGEAASEMDGVPFTDAAQRDARRAELDRDVERLNTICRPRG